MPDAGSHSNACSTPRRRLHDRACLVTIQPMKSKSASRAGLFEDLGRLTLRVGFGVLIMFHGMYKVRNGVGAIQASLVAEGLPPVLAYGVYMGELVAPSLIILGAFTRPAAMVLAFTMLTAMYLMCADQFGALTGRGGWGVVAA